MPIYDYHCTSCSHRFELRQGFSAEPVEACPACHGQANRLFHPATVIYKGSGFYTTDYARKHVSAPSSSTNGPPPDTSAKNDTAPAEKHEEVKTSEE